MPYIMVFYYVLVPTIRYQFLGRQLRDQPLLGDVGTFLQILFYFKCYVSFVNVI